MWFTANALRWRSAIHSLRCGFNSASSGALSISPGSFSILVCYASWASALGEPVCGAAIADRAVQINPNFQPWASAGLRYAYFMVGRYEDALRVMERQTPNNYSKYA
jgi:hypothetical protein